MKEGGIDDRLSYHVAALFVRDPMPAYTKELKDDKINDTKDTCHFENVNSTNWNSLRFKPPPGPDSDIGWRVEFRTMDNQLTDFESSSLIVLLGMVVNIINNFNVDFIMPITKIDENMERAHTIDGVFKEKFW